MKRSISVLAGMTCGICFIAAIGTSQPPSAPAVDRVGFPTGYQNWKLLYVFDRPDNKTVRTVYGNDLAASTGPY